MQRCHNLICRLTLIHSHYRYCLNFIPSILCSLNLFIALVGYKLHRCHHCRSLMVWNQGFEALSYSVNFIASRSCRAIQLKIIRKRWHSDDQVAAYSPCQSLIHSYYSLQSLFHLQCRQCSKLSGGWNRPGAMKQNSVHLRINQSALGVNRDSQASCFVVWRPTWIRVIGLCHRIVNGNRRRLATWLICVADCLSRRRHIGSRCTFLWLHPPWHRLIWKVLYYLIIERESNQMDTQVSFKVWAR